MNWLNFVTLILFSKLTCQYGKSSKKKKKLQQWKTYRWGTLILFSQKKKKKSIFLKFFIYLLFFFKKAITPMDLYLDSKDKYFNVHQSSYVFWFCLAHSIPSNVVKPVLCIKILQETLQTVQP